MKEENSQPLSRVYFSALVAGLLSFTFGITLTIFSGSKDYFGDKNFDRFGPCLCFGAMLGSLIQWPDMRHTILTISAMYIFGYVGCAFLQQYGFIFFIINGLATGSVCSTVGSYLSKIAPLEIRGKICLIHQFFLSLGILLGSILAYFSKERYLFLPVAIIPSIVLFCTPKIIYKTQEWPNMLLVLKKRKSLLISVALHLIQQLALINPIIFKAPEYLKDLNDKPGLKTIMFNVFGLISSISAAFIIERFGRKFLLIGSYVIVAVALFAISQKFYLEWFMYVYIIGFCFGLGPLTWVLNAEIFDPEYVAGAMAIGTIANWGFGTAIVPLFVYLYGKDNNYVAFSYFIPFLIAGIVMVAFYLPETKGRPSKCL